MPQAVIYARYSSGHQREESIEGQIRECTDFALHNGLTVISHYIDRAISAKTDDRPEFQKMIADSNKKTFDTIIVYTLDRFARNRYDSAVYKAKLKRNDVKVLSAKENITSDPSGIILESVLEGMAEYYSVELAQKVRRGMTENALACRWASGRIPFGYTIDAEKHLQINEPLVPIVQKAFEMYAAGNKIVDIIKYVNSCHVVTGMGNKFGRSSLDRMLRSETYIGVFRWADIRKENAVPAIISHDLFYKCQARHNTTRHKNTARPSELYLLSSKIRCGCCGSAMVGMSGKSRNGNLYHYYSCYSTRRHTTKCDTGHLRRDKLEQTIADHAAAILKIPENLNIISEQAIKANTEAKNYHLESMIKQKKDISKKLDNCMKAVDKGLVSVTLMERIKQYEAELESLEKDISLEKIKTNPFTVTKQHIAFFLTKFAELEGTEFRERIISTLVREVLIKKEKDGNYSVTVKYNYVPTNELPNEESYPANRHIGSQNVELVETSGIEPLTS